MNIIEIRASSLGELFDCPARWEAKHIKGMRMPSSSAAALGTAVHAGTAVFDASRLGGGTGVSIDDAAGAVVDSIYKPDYDIDWAEDKPADSEKIAIALHNKYCATIAPTQDYAAVEVTCERLEISDLGIALKGTVDRVHRGETGFGISDLKTGKTAVGADGSVKTAGHAFQLGVYELLAQHASGLNITEPAQIIGMNTAVTDKAQRTGIGSVSGAREVLVGDADQPGVLEAAATMVHSGTFFGNPRSMLCGPKYCPAFATCRFRK